MHPLVPLVIAGSAIIEFALAAFLPAARIPLILAGAATLALGIFLWSRMNTSPADPLPPIEASRLGELRGTVRDFDRLPESDALMGELASLLERRRKIDAIKLVREHSGLGLKEAKDLCETLEARLRRASG